MRQETRAAYEVWLRAAGLVLVATALVAFLSGFYSKKFHLVTGPAEWIWVDHDLDEKLPIAFFVTRDVVVPPDPPFVRLRIACEADWSLYLNGEEIAGGGTSRAARLLELDISPLARMGENNRLVVALRSGTGVGGLLASIDYAPLRENEVVTDESWKVCREWSDGLLTGDLVCSESPLRFGTPPFGRWNYPETLRGTFYPSGEREAMEAREVVAVEIPRREIRVISGVAIESSTIVPGRLFDFGLVDARGRLTLAEPAKEVSVVEVRYALDAADLGKVAENVEFVFAPGETTVTDPVAREFRFMAVVGDVADATALSWKESSATSP